MVSSIFWKIEKYKPDEKISSKLMDNGFTLGQVVSLLIAKIKEEDCLKLGAH